MIATKTLGMPKRAKEKTVTIRITERVSQMIETISLAEGESSADIASPILEKALQKRYFAAVDSINAKREQFDKELP